MDDMVTLNERETGDGQRIADVSLIDPNGGVLLTVTANITHLYQNGQTPSDETIIMDIAWSSTGEDTRAMERIVSTLIRESHRLAEEEAADAEQTPVAG
jgi:hypothetical protein